MPGARAASPHWAATSPPFCTGTATTPSYPPGPSASPRLASTRACPNQAFRLDRYVLGLQFPLEPRPEDIEVWLLGHVHEIAATPGVSVAGIQADTALYGATVAEAGQDVFAKWLAQVELSAP
jgi:GMP synthase (glutamine-hydrolysing)